MCVIIMVDGWSDERIVYGLLGVGKSNMNDVSDNYHKKTMSYNTINSRFPNHYFNIPESISNINKMSSSDTITQKYELINHYNNITS